MAVKMTKEERLEARKKAYEFWALTDGQASFVRLSKETGLTIEQLKKYKGQDKWQARYEKDFTKGKFKKQAKKESKKIKHKELIEDINDIQQITINNNLTDREALFVMYYLQTYNITQAAKNVGYAPSSANCRGFELYNKKHVKKALREIKALMSQTIHLETKDIIAKYIKIAFSDITDFVEFKDNYLQLKNSNQVDGSLISEIKQGRDGISIKLHDKMKALDKLDKLFDAIPDRKLQLEKEKFEFQKDVADKAISEGKSVTIINDLG